MISAVEIEEQEFAVAIAELAGQPDIERFCLDGHLLIVQGVPQEVLEQASAAYHLQVTEQRSRALFKQQRAEAVAAIKVTTSAGHVFDGDEISQGRWPGRSLACRLKEVALSCCGCSPTTR